MRVKLSVRFGLAFFVCVTVIVVVGGFNSLMAAPNRSEIRHFVLPMRIEGNIAPSPLNISLQTLEYNQPVSDFLKSTDAGAAERALARLMVAIRTRNREAFKSLTVEENHAHIEQLMNMYAPALKDIPNPILMRRFDIGRIAVLVVEVGKEDAPTASFAFREEKGVALLSASSFSHPILQNILSLAMVLATDAPKYTLSKSSNSGSMIQFNDLFGDSGTNPVSISFSGIPMLYPMMMKNIGDRSASRKVQPALSALENSLRALRDGALQQHLDSFSEKSRERVDDLMKDPSKARFEWYQKSSTQFRQVNYVLYGRGIYILFHQPQRGKYQGSAIYYEIMGADHKNNIKRVNYNAMGPVHNLLHWSEFSKKMIRDIINAPGTAP